MTRDFGAHDNIVIIHAIFASILTLFIVPSAILIARYKLNPKSTAPQTRSEAENGFAPKSWLKTHIWFNITSLLLVLVVFALGISAVLTAGEGIQFAGPNRDVHHDLGLVLTVLIVGQVGLGYMAHKKPSGRQAVQLENNRIDDVVLDEEEEREERMDLANEKDYKDIEKEDEDDNLPESQGQGRGCCSGSDPTAAGGCSCAMSSLNGAPCCCAGKGDQVDILPKEKKNRSGRTRSETTGMKGTRDEKAEKGEKKHWMRFLHHGVGIVIACGLYWEAWNGLNLEYDSMTVSSTFVPQSVQSLYWILLAPPACLYVYNVGNGWLMWLGEESSKLETLEREKQKAGREERERLLKGEGKGE